MPALLVRRVAATALNLTMITSLESYFTGKIWSWGPTPLATGTVLIHQHVSCQTQIEASGADVMHGCCATQWERPWVTGCVIVCWGCRMKSVWFCFAVENPALKMKPHISQLLHKNPWLRVCVTEDIDCWLVILWEFDSVDTVNFPLLFYN